MVYLKYLFSKKCEKVTDQENPNSGLSSSLSQQERHKTIVVF